MRATITATFDSADEAERAVLRLRRSIRDLRVETCGGDPGTSPADAPCFASVYCPWRSDGAESGPSAMPWELGSRVLFTSDVLGLPVCRSGEATVQLLLPAEEAERARAMLVNAGGRHVRLY